MKINHTIFFGLVCFVMTSCNDVVENTDPVNFNKGWRFYKGEANNAESLNFDDSLWRDRKSVV